MVEFAHAENVRAKEPWLCLGANSPTNTGKKSVNYSPFARNPGARKIAKEAVLLPMTGNVLRGFFGYCAPERPGKTCPDDMELRAQSIAG